MSLIIYIIIIILIIMQTFFYFFSTQIMQLYNIKQFEMQSFRSCYLESVNSTFDAIYLYGLVRVFISVAVIKNELEITERIIWFMIWSGSLVSKQLEQNCEQSETRPRQVISIVFQVFKFSLKFIYLDCLYCLDLLQFVSWQIVSLSTSMSLFGPRTAMSLGGAIGTVLTVDWNCRRRGPRRSSSPPCIVEESSLPEWWESCHVSPCTV